MRFHVTEISNYKHMKSLIKKEKKEVKKENLKQAQCCAKTSSLRPGCHD
jgi:hypothetical protein